MQVVKATGCSADDGIAEATSEAGHIKIVDISRATFSLSLGWNVYEIARRQIRDTLMDTKLDRSPTHLLHRILQCASSVFDAEKGDADLTPRQVSVLVTVARNDGLSQIGIVEKTGIDRSTLADIVRRLQRKGLLHRRRTREDARAYAVRLTDEGQRITRLAAPLIQRVDESILSSLPARERDRFISALKTIVVDLESKAARS
jgi:DNA-binding MarR family transcriptional regulator